MRKITHKHASLLSGLIILVTCLCFVLIVSQAWAEPKNIILLIGDGMGPEHVKAAGMYASGSAGTLYFEGFPYRGQVSTYSADSAVTDSAAGATAIATHTKVNNGVVSIKLPGDGSELYTLLEYFRDMGKSTGLVTSDMMTGATPAGFGAHNVSRADITDLANDYLNQTRPNVLFGGGGYGMSVSAAQYAGYTVISNKSGMSNLNTETESMVSGQFGDGALPYEYDGNFGSSPHLSETTTKALEILDNNPNGFFLMVEGARIDHAAHENNIQRDIFEVLEFNNTVLAALDWAATHSDTLVLVTADHETGGLTVVKNNGANAFPTVTWSTAGHTGVYVGIYATGENAQLFTGTQDNTHIYGKITSTTNDSVVYYCDNDSDSYISLSAGGTCTGFGCEPYGCKKSPGYDCNDNAVSIHPGAQEDCLDGFDNDCDGLIDQNDPNAVNCTFTCTDTDGDNYLLEGGLCGPVDCNDADDAINPAACDIIGDGIDQDCNGKDRTKGKDCPPYNVTREICYDGIDNDGDGKTDCADKKDCVKAPNCS